jgi:alpha-beta hydrolase superfamily lysophospholipase
MLYRSEAQGDWGRMLESDVIKTTTETLVAADGCKLFLRSWIRAGSSDVLLILHGLGAHSGWFIDMCNELSTRGISVYAMDHRGFGRSEGIPGHIDRYHTYVEDIVSVVAEIRKRHPDANIYLFGHSMGAIFATHFAAKYQHMLAGVIYLNPWIQDSSRISLGTTLAILGGGIFKSQRSWQVAGGTETMTTNAEAIEMLQADPYWRRTQTSSFLVQILNMRMATLRQARLITIPALVMQAEADKAVLADGTRKLYEALAGSDKTWKTHPGYGHDSEFEADRSQMDNDLVAWIRERAVSTTGANVTLP